MKGITRTALALALAAAAGLTFAPLAVAGVVDTNHDMIFKMTAYTGSQKKAGTCSFCHIPHKAGGDKLWSSSYTSGTGWRAEVISQLCYSCHAFSTYTGAQNVNPFGATEHGRTVNSLTTWGDRASINTAVYPLAGDSNLKCTSCHDVHNNDVRPFLRNGTTDTFTFNVFCEGCHTNRANTGGAGTQQTANIVAATAGPNGAGNYSQHPTDQGIADTTTENFLATIATEFEVNPGDPTQNGVAGAAAGWNLGGHRNNGLATGNFGCATCHAVHGNESANFSAADGSSAVAAEQVPPYNAVLVRNPAPTTVSPAVCTGCHESVSPHAGGAGPGATGVTHPYDNSAAWTITGIPAPSSLDAYSNLIAWGDNGGVQVLVCTSCHDMHYAFPGTSLLRPYGATPTIDSPVASSNSNCNLCHSTSTQANHHPAGITLAASTEPDMGTTATQTTAATWSSLTKGTAGTPYTYGPSNLVTCTTCHAGSAGAHNNTGSFPGLAGYNASSEMCVDCHTFNPSAYSINAHPGTAEASGIPDTSHYVGTIQTTGYKFTGAFASGYAAKWGDSGAAIICESCHTLKFKTTLPRTSTNTAVAGAVDASIGLLLENSGNLNLTYFGSGGTGPDLCTRCHGGSPSGGSAGSGTTTHPTISAGMTSAASGGVQSKVTGGTAGTVTLTAGNLVNCESCHRPHDAAAGSGALILEGVGTDSTKVFNDRATGNGGSNYASEATFCNMCHNY